MSAATVTAPATQAPPASGGSTPHLSFARLVRSEWIKFWTVRSTVWTLALTLVALVGISALVSWGATQNTEDPGGPATDITFILQLATSFAQLAIAVLGVLTITGEYTTGMIRSTLTAAPKRLPALWAKGVVLVVVTFVTGVVAAAVTWVATAPILDSAGLSFDLAQSDVQRVFLGIPLYLTGIALLSYALGALLRHSAAAIATVLGLLLVIENVWGILPWRFFQVTSPFLPSTAGGKILQSQDMIDAMAQGATGPVLTAWQGYGVLLAWGLVILAAAALLLRRRDA